jgi:L-arabinose isomerase
MKMMDITIGLLPLYAGLYDRDNPQAKYGYKNYIGEIEALFANNGVKVRVSSVGIYEDDIRIAVNSFENAGVSLIVVLFLAYHPSLESCPVLSTTKIPVALLDTTSAFAFGPDTDPALIEDCHGIHGVQDLCCVLQRAGKPYRVFAGHYKESDAVKRCVDYAKAAVMATTFMNSRVGLIGEPFEKMGDFAVGFEQMEKLFGIKTIRLDRQNALHHLNSLTQAEVARADRENRSVFMIEEGLDNNYLDLAAKTGAVIKKWIASEELNAFTFNFLAFKNDPGIPAIPFAAASLLMGKGVGYAGEGDVLTAALTAALMRVYPDSTFTEMFCPDWQGNTVFMSHMGEVNHKTTSWAKLIKTTVSYVPEINGGEMPGVAGLYKEGNAVLVNLAPMAGGTFSLILAPCGICGIDSSDRLESTVHGWLRPPMELGRFLEEYSNLGGTHHSCLCYDADINTLSEFGGIMSWKVHILG